MSSRRTMLAYVLPMATFLAFLSLGSVLKWVGGYAWLSGSDYWIYPVQTVACGFLLLAFRRIYPLSLPVLPGFGLLLGILVFVLWIAPQTFFGFPARLSGFNPDQFAGQPAIYWGTVFFRFVRLVLVVPLVEEIFWRGFLLRFFIDEDFQRVPLGTFSWLSFGAVTLAFGFSHNRPDWLAALLTGMLFNLVIYRTRSLSTCVLTHAITNLLLGLWIMKTGQWGFW